MDQIRLRSIEDELKLVVEKHEQEEHLLRMGMEQREGVINELNEELVGVKLECGKYREESIRVREENIEQQLGMARQREEVLRL